MINVSSLSELDKVLDTDEPVVVDFAKRHGCAPCGVLAPHFEAADRAMPHVEFVTVYLDELEQEELFHIMDNFGVRSTPTLFLFDKHLVAKITARTGPLLIKEISSLL